MELDNKYFDPTSPLGVFVRYIHEGCSDGKDACLNVVRKEDGWFYECHRCGIRGKKSIATAPLSDLIKHTQNLQRTYQTEQGDIKLPDDYTQDIPKEGMKWLLKYLTPDQIKEYHIGFSPSLNRIIFPLFKKDKLVYWQGRYINWDNKYKTPKYKNIRASKDTLFAIRNPSSDVLVLVEDIVSAIKVSQHANVVSLLGSTLDDQKILQWSKFFRVIIVWLDYDKAEYSLNKTFRYKKFGLNVRSCLTKLDPKEYSFRTMKDYLEVISA